MDVWRERARFGRRCVVKAEGIRRGEKQERGSFSESRGEEEVSKKLEG